MKKTVLKAIVLALSMSLLTGCVLYNGKNKDGSPKGGSSSQPSSSEPSTSDTTSSSSEDPEVPPDVPPTPPTPTDQDVTLYLVLGPNGRYEGNPGADVPTKYLENAKEITVKVNSELPGASKVTSVVSGSSFSHWIDRETTEQVKYAPDHSAVLVAVFAGGDGGNTPVTPDDGLPTSGFGFLFQVADGEDPYYKVSQDRGMENIGGVDFHQYQIADFQLVQGQRFQLIDFESRGRWTVNLDPASCGHMPNSYITIDGTVGTENSYYVVQKTFNAKDIYIKLAYQQDQLYIGKEAEPGDLPTEGFGFLFKTEPGVEPYYKLSTPVDEYDGFEQHKVDDFRLVEGQQFQLYNFAQGAGWTVPLDAASCGGHPDNYISKGTDWYTVIQTFDAKDIYIKLKWEQDQLYIGIDNGGSTPEPDPASIPTTIYFEPNADWASSNAKFAVFYEGGTWVEGTDSNSDGVWEFANTNQIGKVIFVRVGPDQEIPLDSSWTGKLNQSPNDGFHSIPTDGKNKATMTGTGYEDWNYYPITWSVLGA